MNLFISQQRDHVNQVFLQCNPVIDYIAVKLIYKFHTMKKLLTVIVAVIALGLVSCEKDTVQLEIPGNIPGFGNTPGEIEISEKFVLPEGIKVAGDITGVEAGEATLKSANNLWSHVGSGNYVVLKLTLQNTSNQKRTVFFPQGLIWEAKTAGYQHGIQIQTTWVTLNPNQTKYLKIHLYCINQGLLPSDANGVFGFLGVTSSKIIWRLLDLIGWRMVNYEMIMVNNGNGPKTNLKSAVPYTFDEVSTRLQAIVYKLTDTGEDLNEADKQFIESIPELPLDQRPNRDAYGKFPDFFPDYGVTVE